MRVLTLLALCSRVSLAIRAFLRLAMSLLLLLLDAAFTNIEFLEALGKTICFNVMYQLT